MAYQVGQQVRLTGTFRNPEGQLADPTACTVKVRDAGGTAITYNDAVKDSTGVFHKDITVTKPATGGGGTWYYRFEGTGAVIAANETSFAVEQTQF
jgi:hypothetical protein